MRVGHHDRERPHRRRVDLGDGVGRLDPLHPGRRQLRKSLLAACRSSAPGTAAAPGPAPAPARHGRRRTAAPASPPRRNVSSPRPLAASRRSRPSAADELRVENGPPASASASGSSSATSRASKISSVHSTRPPQHWPSCGPSASVRRSNGPRPRASAACAAAIASHSSAPPPMVPAKAPDGRTTMRAPRPRGADPSDADDGDQRSRSFLADRRQQRLKNLQSPIFPLASLFTRLRSLARGIRAQRGIEEEPDEAEVDAVRSRRFRAQVHTRRRRRRRRADPRSRGFRRAFRKAARPRPCRRAAHRRAAPLGPSSCASTPSTPASRSKTSPPSSSRASTGSCCPKRKAPPTSSASAITSTRWRPRPAWRPAR